MFRGVSAVNVDSKGRMAIPTKYRDRLHEICNAQLVVTIDKDRCLLIYPETVWVEIEAKLKSLPSFNKTSRMLQRLYIGHAQDVEMDGQGRILLPPKLRAYAKLEKKVALVGQGDKFEVWDEETWDRRRDDWLEEVDLSEIELPAEFESLSI